MAPVQLIGAIRPDDGQPLGPRVARQERQDVARRAVSPVQVLDDEDHRDPIAQRSQEDKQALEDPSLDPARAIERIGLRGRRWSELGQQAAEVTRLGQSQLVDVADRAGLTGGDDPGQTAQRLDDRSERQALAAAERHAATLEHQRSVLTRQTGCLRDETGLADAGIPAHEHDDGVAGAPAHERVAERSELSRATDEVRARDPRGHGPMVRGLACRPWPDDRHAVAGVPAIRRRRADIRPFFGWSTVRAGRSGVRAAISW